MFQSSLWPALILSAAVMPAAAQQNYPERPVRIVVPFPPGGVVDMLARDISQKFNARWGQPVIVDNRGGANGNIGAELVAKARPDGYTLLIAPANIAISVPLYKKLAYDLFKDLAPVTLLASGPYILVTAPSLPVKSVAELVALARARPGQITMGSSGTGSAGHLAGDLLQNATGVRFTHVPYKGQVAVMVDTISGQISMFFGTVAVVNPHLTDGRIKILAVTTRERSSTMPGVPTIAESGFPGFDVGAWHGFFAPAGTAPDILAKLHDELTRFLTAPESRKFYQQQGTELAGSTPEAFTRFLHAEVAKYEQAIRKANVQPE
jgi:tripartite-type tricarboxylate transporter receptor subunit TctC